MKYVREPAPCPARTPGDADEPSILFDPLMNGAPGAAGPEDPVALALVRGVLYALSATNGEVRWAVARRRRYDGAAGAGARRRRHRGDHPRPLVRRRDAVGARHARARRAGATGLGAAVLGRPVVIDQRAYLATYAGEVHEIELNEGKLLGRYLLGQRLTLGGSHEPGTAPPLLPRRRRLRLRPRRGQAGVRADRLQPPPRRGRCAASRSSSRRWSEDSPGYLVLTQTDGLDRVRMRVWEMTAKDRKLVEKALDPRVALAGWTWFSPYHDPEKIVIALRRRRPGHDRHPPGARTATRRCSRCCPAAASTWGRCCGPPAAGRRDRGRAEVAQVQGDDLWVTAEGRMMRLRLAWGPAQGPRMVPAWPAPLEVGSPIHASQVFDDRRRAARAWSSSPGPSAGPAPGPAGSTTRTRRPALAAATRPGVRPRAGARSRAAAASPIWLAIDQGGGLFGLDPARYPVRPGARWLSDDKMRPLADSLPENADRPPLVLTSEDGKTTHVLAFPGDGLEMVVREVDGGADGPDSRVKEVPGQAGVRSSPGSRRGSAITSCCRSPTARWPGWRCRSTPTTPDLEYGLPWRADRVGAEARGFVAGLGPDRFVTSDGARGLAAWEWEPRTADWDGPARRAAATSRRCRWPPASPAWSACPARTPTLAVGRRRRQALARRGQGERRRWRSCGPGI